MQVLNLAVKLYLTNPHQAELLCQYLFSLARYDENYDIRDRARFLKPFVFPANGETILSKNAKKIFMAAKPAPLLESKYQGREQYQLGSLSHYLNIRANGYHDLPAFPKTAPDASVRGVENSVNDNSSDAQQNEGTESGWADKNSKAANKSKSNKKDKSFYSESENESSEDESSDDSESGESSENESESDANEESDEDGSGKSDDESNESSSTNSGTSDSSGESDEDESSDESEDEPKEITKKIPAQSNSKEKPMPPVKQERSNLDLLLDLDDIAPTGPIMTPSLGTFFFVKKFMVRLIDPFSK